MLMTAWNPRPGVLPNLMWIMDRVFKFTNFGIVSVLHEDFFIQAVSHFSHPYPLLFDRRLV
jgi:lysophosphatidylglycerol acyltransferase 1